MRWAHRFAPRRVHGEPSCRCDVRSTTSTIDWCDAHLRKSLVCPTCLRLGDRIDSRMHLLIGMSCLGGARVPLGGVELLVHPVRDVSARPMIPQPG